MSKKRKKKTAFIKKQPLSGDKPRITILVDGAPISRQGSHG